MQASAEKRSKMYPHLSGLSSGGMDDLKREPTSGRMNSLKGRLASHRCSSADSWSSVQRTALAACGLNPSNSRNWTRTRHDCRAQCRHAADCAPLNAFMRIGVVADNVADADITLDAAFFGFLENCLRLLSCHEYRLKYHIIVVFCRCE